MISILNRIVKWMVLVLGVVLALYTAVYFVVEGTKVVNYHFSGTVFTDVKLTPDSLITLVRLDTSEFIQAVYPALGDTIISINDSSATLARWNANFFSPLGPDRVIPIEFKHEGQEFRALLKTHAPYLSEFIQVLVLEIVRFLLAASFIVVGMWAYLQRSEAGGVRALALFCYAMTSFLVFSISALSSRYASFSIPLNNIFQNFFGFLTPFFGGFWLNLQLLFPQPKKFIRDKPLLAYLLCYAPIALLIVIFLVYQNVANPLALLIIPLQVIIGLIILGVGYFRTSDSLSKRQMRLVLTGSGFGLFALLVFITIAITFNEWFTWWRWNALAVTLVFLALLLSPLSFAYAFQRYRLLEVEGKLRRGTRYALVTIVLLALFVGIVYLMGMLLVKRLGVTSRTPTFMIALILALGFTPALQKLQGQVERRFFPERQHLREMIRDFLQKLPSFPDHKTLWSQVENRLRESAKIKSIFPLLLVHSARRLYLEGENREPTPFQIGQGIATKLQEDRRPVLVDEAIASARFGMTLEEEIWLNQRNIAILLPMMVHSNLIGILGLSTKMGEEDYSAEEVLILCSLASQLALASENIWLLQENMEKKRMEEELQIARNIQKGFLPGVIPATPGLEIAAGSRFCLEVAGDYYDVIALDNGETMLAVGDVSGKGAGAALLMANLQASLRTASGMGIPLNDIVSRINELICHNTPPEQYITFFAGMYHPKTKTFIYVNAGHNPPLVIRKNGKVETLYQGGLILGFEENRKYEQGSIKLQAGDVILMYTDGVSEAMNEKEEEFGENRIMEFIQQNLTLPTEEIVAGLEKSVEVFTGDRMFTDDFTLILVRVIR